MYVTLADYEQWAGPAADVEAINRINVSLEAACDAVKDHISQHIEYVADDEIQVPGSGTQFLLLPELPVVAVSTVADEDAEAVDDWVLRDSGILYRSAGWRCDQTYTVTYDHGWEVVPADIRMATLRLTQAYSAATDGKLVQETIGGWSGSYDRNDDPLSSLDRRIVKRVPMP